MEVLNRGITLVAWEVPHADLARRAVKDSGVGKPTNLIVAVRIWGTVPNPCTPTKELLYSVAYRGMSCRTGYGRYMSSSTVSPTGVVRTGSAAAGRSAVSPIDKGCATGSAATSSWPAKTASR